jgi:hypothetical protein
MHKPVVIIPSIRTIDARNIAAIPEDVDIFVVDDSDGSIKPSRPRMKVFTYQDQRDVMGPDYDLIPHKTAACRNFGYIYVHKYTDHDVIINIDDDCLCPPDFMSAYAAVGTTREWPNVTVADSWYNTIEFLGVRGASGRTLYPRGFPYWLRRPGAETRSAVRGRLACLMGLWSNVLDHDGIDKYMFEDYRATYEVRPSDPVLTVGTPATPTKFPLCAMNFAVHRDLLVAAFQLPWGKDVVPGYNAERFDDIWGGYILEALVHKRANGDVVAVGHPVVKHLKEGNLHREVTGEHLGHLMAPYLYELIDAGVASIAPGAYPDMYFDLFNVLVEEFSALTKDLRVPAAYCPYYLDLFERLRRWGALFTSSPSRTVRPDARRV